MCLLHRLQWAFSLPRLPKLLINPCYLHISSYLAHHTGPLTQLVKRGLVIHNPNPHPIAFKVKTTAPKQYCVRPNSGRVESGETVEVQGGSEVSAPRKLRMLTDIFLQLLPTALPTD